jgi:hypothetical protein
MWNPFKKKNPVKDGIFCECDDGKHKWCTSPGAVIEALTDACNEMSYSNWACDKFHRAQVVIRKYAKKNNIPMYWPPSIDMIPYDAKDRP